jgi:hypothetical protein
LFRYGYSVTITRYYAHFPSPLQDNGEQGAWYVLSALGLYSVTPGNGLFSSASLPMFFYGALVDQVDFGVSIPCF